MFRTTLLFLVLGFVWLPSSSEAASLYFDPGESILHSGDSIVMAVRVNTDPGECINVVDGVISYDPAIQPVDISRGQSIFPLWVEEPTIDKANSRISFAAGIPNGYCGRIEGDPKLTNEVFKIVFQVPGLRIGSSPSSPTTTVEFTDETHVYLNDGAGTLASLFTIPAELVVLDTPGNEVKNEWSRLVRGDDQNPQQFSVALVQDNTVYGGQYYVVFNTTDKQTGIAYYEVMEEPLSQASSFSWGREDAPWVISKSPYVLKDQSLNSTIRVKAVDKAGNEYVAVLVPDETLRSVSMDTFLLYALASSLGVLVIVLLVFLYLRFKRSRKARLEEDVEEVEDEDFEDEE